MKNSAGQTENVIPLASSDYNTKYFNSIDAIRDFINVLDWTPQKPSALSGQLRWQYVHDPHDLSRRVIYPSNPSPIFFRGQTKRYQPCHSALNLCLAPGARTLSELPEDQQVRLILGLIRTQWFIECMRRTPIFEWAEQERVSMNETAIAQHYGLPTGYIDLSQSFEVASFFACCQYNSEEQKWEAATSEEGIMYVVDIRKAPFTSIKPIHLQPFPQPSEQWAWTYETILGDDFDQMPNVFKLIFKQNREASEAILSQYNNGNCLFPPDPLVAVAERIKASQIIPRAIALKVIEDIIEPHGLPNSTIKDILLLLTEQEPGVNIIDGLPVIIDPKIRAEMEQVWEQRRDDFCQGIGIELVRAKITHKK